MGPPPSGPRTPLNFCGTRPDRSGTPPDGAGYPTENPRGSPIGVDMAPAEADNSTRCEAGLRVSGSGSRKPHFDRGDDRLEPVAVYVTIIVDKMPRDAYT